MMHHTAVQNIYHHTHFTRLAQQFASNGSSWPQEVRQEAFSRFAAIGFPSTQQEAWKHTSVAALAKIPFTPAAQAPVALPDDPKHRGSVYDKDKEEQPGLGL